MNASVHFDGNRFFNEQYPRRVLYSHGDQYDINFIRPYFAEIPRSQAIHFFLEHESEIPFEVRKTLITVDKFFDHFPKIYAEKAKFYLDWYANYSNMRNEVYAVNNEITSIEKELKSGEENLQVVHKILKLPSVNSDFKLSAYNTYAAVNFASSIGGDIKKVSDKLSSVDLVNLGFQIVGNYKMNVYIFDAKLGACINGAEISAVQALEQVMNEKTIYAEERDFNTLASMLIQESYVLVHFNSVYQLTQTLLNRASQNLNLGSESRSRIRKLVMDRVAVMSANLGRDVSGPIEDLINDAFPADLDSKNQAALATKNQQINELTLKIEALKQRKADLMERRTALSLEEALLEVELMASGR